MIKIILEKETIQHRQPEQPHSDNAKEKRGK